MLAQTAVSKQAPVAAAPAVVVNVSNVNDTDFYTDPGCCMKCCCPVCSVCATYGDCRCPQVLLALIFGCSYTMCCWFPASEKRP